MTDRELLAKLLPLAEGFVQGMHRDPSRYPPESIALALSYLVEARRALGLPTPEGVK